MKLLDYLEALTVALKANEHVTRVTTSDVNLPYGTTRVVVDYGKGQRARCFVSEEAVEQYHSVDDGVELARFLMVIEKNMEAVA